MNLTSKIALMYIFKNPEFEVQGLLLIYSEEIKAMKALHHEGAAFMAFLFGNLSAISSHEGQPYLPRRKKIKLFGGFMEKTVCKKVATVQFWDIYAKWYKCWMEHNNYHNRIIDVLTTMAEPGWRALDIGAGNGVLSLPLCAIECDVTALEPSSGIRSLFYEEAMKRGIDWINVDERRWEDVPSFELNDYDLIMACNSLHLTEMGFKQALEKIFHAKPKNVFVITELGPPEIKVKWQYRDYTMAFTKCYETESSFAYHHMDEAFEHYSLKKGKPLSCDERTSLKAQLTYEDDHFWMKDTAYIGMYWWERNH